MSLFQVKFSTPLRLELALFTFTGACNDSLRVLTNETTATVGTLLEWGFCNVRARSVAIFFNL